MESTDYYTNGTVSFNGTEIVSNGYKIYFPAKKLVSGKETMDEYAQEALKADKYNNIEFALNNVTGSGSNAKANGILKIAGHAENVSIPVSVTNVGNKAVVKGKTKINLPKYTVEPPSVMFGTIVCGDDVDVEFQFAFNLK